MKGFTLKFGTCLIFIIASVISSAARDGFVNDTTMACKYLRERGEVYFSFKVSHEEISRFSLIVSVDNYKDGLVYAYANKKEFEAFLDESLEFTVYTPPGGWYRDKLPLEKEFVREDNSVKGEWDYYPTYTGYVEMMQGWADDYPELCEYIDAGKSVQGRSILFMKITGNKDYDDPKPRFMYSSTMHGDETVGYILMLRLIEHLLENYPDDRQIELLLDNIEIWINPLANPDGTYYGDDYETIETPKRYNANNADLNRNFPALDEPDYTTGNRQPETVIMMDMMEAKMFSLSANMHGGAEVMNYPWDYWERRHADNDWFEYICREYADTAQHYSPSGYMTFLGGVTNGYDWYSISGGRQDYVTYYTGGREVTMEISEQKHPPPGALPDYWEYNRQALLNYMEQTMFGIRGRISDAVTGEALKAKVEILSYDTDSSCVFTDESTGWYFRLLKQDSYDIRITSEGYYSDTVRSFPVEDRVMSRLDVQLEPVFTGSRLSDPSEKILINIFPVPSGNMINVSIDLPVTSRVEIFLYDNTGRRIKLFYRGLVEGGGEILSFDTAGIPSGVYIMSIKHNNSLVSRKILIVKAP